ncbi:uncharacterized protein LOC144685626 [Cetorhinus maximus]
MFVCSLKPDNQKAMNSTCERADSNLLHRKSDLTEIDWCKNEQNGSDCPKDQDAVKQNGTDLQNIELTDLSWVNNFQSLCNKDLAESLSNDNVLTYIMVQNNKDEPGATYSSPLQNEYTSHQPEGIVELIFKELQGLNRIQEEIADLRRHLISLRGSADEVSSCLDAMFETIEWLRDGLQTSSGLCELDRNTNIQDDLLLYFYNIPEEANENTEDTINNHLLKHYYFDGIKQLLHIKEAYRLDLMRNVREEPRPIVVACASPEYWDLICAKCHQLQSMGIEISTYAPSTKYCPNSLTSMKPSRETDLKEHMNETFCICENTLNGIESSSEVELSFKIRKTEEIKMVRNLANREKSYPDKSVEEYELTLAANVDGFSDACVTNQIVDINYLPRIGASETSGCFVGFIEYHEMSSEDLTVLEQSCPCKCQNCTEEGYYIHQKKEHYFKMSSENQTVDPFLDKYLVSTNQVPELPNGEVHGYIETLQSNADISLLSTVYTGEKNLSNNISLSCSGGDGLVSNFNDEMFENDHVGYEEWSHFSEQSFDKMGTFGDHDQGNINSTDVKFNLKKLGRRILDFKSALKEAFTGLDNTNSQNHEDLLNFNSSDFNTWNPAASNNSIKSYRKKYLERENGNGSKDLFKDSAKEEHNRLIDEAGADHKLPLVDGCFTCSQHEVLDCSLQSWLTCKTKNSSEDQVLLSFCGGPEINGNREKVFLRSHTFEHRTSMQQTVCRDKEHLNKCLHNFRNVLEERQQRALKTMEHNANQWYGDRQKAREPGTY